VDTAFPLQPPFAPPVVTPHGSKTIDGHVLGRYTFWSRTDRGYSRSVSAGYGEDTPHLHQNTPGPLEGQIWDAGAVMTEEEMLADVMTEAEMLPHTAQGARAAQESDRKREGASERERDARSVAGK
jgi:hypothetical protein